MPKIFNHNTVDLKYKDSPIPEFKWLTSKNLSHAAGIKDFICNIRVLEKGKYSYPYHYHHNADELIVILSGKAKLRIPEKIAEINQGDIVLFSRGESEAHQILNDQNIACVYLDLRTLHNIDICEYPDTGKINILPAGDIFYRGQTTSYFDGEENVVCKWPE